MQDAEMHFAEVWTPRFPFHNLQDAGYGIRDAEMSFGEICFPQFPFHNLWDAGCGNELW